MQSNNPVFTADAFGRWEDAYGRPISTTMTVQGTAIKAFGLLAILFATASWAWTQASNQAITPGLLMVAGLGGFVVALATTFKPAWSPVSAPIYAALEGVFLGALSNLIAHLKPQFAALPYQAVTLTCATLFLMLLIYATGLIRVTPRLAAGLTAAIGAVCLVYLVSMVLSLFHVAVPIYGSGGIGIGFSVVVVGLAAFSLLLDFDFIEKGQQSGAPRYMEWYGAFGLMVTLVWLYMEILRLLMKLQDRRS